MSERIIQALILRRNYVDYPTGYTNGVACKDLTVLGIYWRSPVTGAGIHSRYELLKDGIKPRTDASRVLHVHNDVTQENLYIAIRDAGSLLDFTNACNACCGNSFVMPSVVIPDVIIEENACPDQDGISSFISFTRALIDDEVYRFTGSIDGVPLATPPAEGFESLAAFKVWADINWSPATVLISGYKVTLRKANAKTGSFFITVSEPAVVVPDPDPEPEPEPEPIDPNALKAVGLGEYIATFLKNNGDVFTVTGDQNAGYSLKKVTALSNVTELDGGQYHCVAKDAAGIVSSVAVNSTNVTTYAVDNLGAAFSADKVYSMFKNILALKNGELYYWSTSFPSAEDILNQGYSGLVPKKLTQPAGKTLVKVCVGSATSYGGLTFALALASDGTIWQWDRAHTIPQLLTGYTGTARDIAVVGPNAIVVETASDIFGTGYLGNYVGAFPFWQNPNFVSIKATWEGAGCVFPSKQLATTYNTLHIIDANDNLFGMGENVQGNIGNGDQWLSWKTYVDGDGNPAPYRGALKNNELVQGPVQIPGKVKKLFTHNTVSFYVYAQDIMGSWYSWGRNKARVLGNQLATDDNTDNTYSEYYNIPGPRHVDPLILTAWTLLPTALPNANRAPVANAGFDQQITGTTATLYGRASHQQQPTGSVTITKTNVWTRISGPNTPTISAPTSADTGVTGLIPGTYVFRNTVTNSNAATDFQNVTLVVLAP